MTQSQIKERIAKAEERKAKKLKTIEKKTTLIEKKTAIITKAGYQITDEDCRRAWDDSYEMYRLITDVKFLSEDIERLKKEIPEIDILIEKYKSQLESKQEEDEIFDNMPEIFKNLEKELYKDWLEYDLKRKAELTEIYAEIGYKEFIKRYSNFDYQLLRYKTEEDLKKENREGAHYFALRLYRKVIDITGEVTDLSDIHLSGPELNGTITGKAGKAVVETIIAGGYNIQREHYRVLVHSI